ncbi:MAG: hypothetical protein IPO27_09280 [Bacteroidetes bacterium]|nr:hypothetical protein [Bacteroidota bacterium]
MIEAVLFTVLALGMLYGIIRLPFFKLSGVPNKIIAIIFILKIGIVQVQVNLAKKYDVNADIYHVFEGTRPFAKLFLTDKTTAFSIFWGQANDVQVKPITSNFPGWNHRLQTHNDTRTLIRLNMVAIPLHWFYFSIMNLWWAFFSLCASVFLCRKIPSLPAFAMLYNKSAIQLAFFICTTSLPGCLFWFSMAFKETVAWCFFALFIIALSNVIARPGFVNIAWFVLSLLIFTSIKLYFAVAVMVFLLFYFTANYFRRFNPIVASLLIFACIVSSWIFAEVFLNYHQFSLAIYQQANNTVNYAAKVDASTLLPSLLQGPSVFEILLAIPEAIFRILAIPFFPETNNAKLLFPILENYVLFSLLLIGMFHFRYKKEFALISIAMLFFALSSTALIGITTPIIGTYIRYKVLFTPFILLALALHIDLSSIKIFRKWS